MDNQDNELLQDWVNDMIDDFNEYREPILDEISLSTIKTICEALSQDVHVFVMSVEIIERYIDGKNAKREVIDDKLLVVSAAILISSKYAGEQIDVKISSINSALSAIKGTPYPARAISMAEIEVLKTLNDTLPVTTIVDDVNTFVERFVRDYQLRANVRVLCLNILEMMYVLRLKWFTDLKKKYNVNNEALDVFYNLIRSKLYIPMGIMLCALKLTKYRNMLKVDHLLIEMSKLSKIHTDHLNILCEKFVSIIKIYLE